MPEYTLRIRRYSPESGEAAYWDERSVDLAGTQSVLDALLKVKGEQDGSIGVRCSCQQGICGSCGVRINGKPGLACNTHLQEAAARTHGTGWNPPVDGEQSPVITVEPMGNMPVLRDLIVDMDSVHWKKIRRVTPWLINKEPVPEREYIVPHENMLDVTQSMACIQCGACVSDCLSMEIDPLFIGPAALAKAYRFVGDPRDAEHEERLTDLAEDAHGIYDCTHCFNCIDACPKGVAPMSQIMRLRRIAGSDFGINDSNNGHRHERAFATLVGDYGLLNEAELLPRSYGGDSWFGKFHPAAGRELLSSLSTIITGLIRGKVSPKVAALGHKIPRDDLHSVKQIYKRVEDRDERYELNLYAVGYEDEEAEEAAPTDESTPERVAGQQPEPGAEQRQPPREESAPPSEESAPSREADTPPADKSPTFPPPEKPSESENEQEAHANESEDAQ